jgi:hypothetical protein
VDLADITAKDILTLLKQQDSKFTGILSDFTLPTHRANTLVENDPGISSKFDDAAPVDHAEAELATAAATIQTGIHYLMKALGKLASDPVIAKRHLLATLSLTLHGFGRLHSNLVGKMVGITEEMKDLVALKSHTGRDMRGVIDDAFFRAGGGSLALSATNPNPMAAHTLGARPFPMGPVPFPKPTTLPFFAAPGPLTLAPVGFPTPSGPFPPPRSRPPFPRPRMGGSPRGRPQSYSPTRGDTRQGSRTRSPPRRH